MGNNYWGAGYGDVETTDECALRGLCPDVNSHQLGSQVRLFPNIQSDGNVVDAIIPEDVKVNISCWNISNDNELNFGLPMGLISGSPNSDIPGQSRYLHGSSSREKMRYYC